MKYSNILFPLEAFTFVFSGFMLGIGKEFAFIMVFTLAIVLAVITGEEIKKETQIECQKSW